MKKRIGIFLTFILELLLLILELKIFNNSFSFDRFLILSFIIIFLCLHLILNIKKMYEFIYKKRYLIGLILLGIITISGYHGSSLGAWNTLLQPNNNVDDGGLILGILRLIRGDEYIVSTPHLLSQTYNNFSSISNILMGKSSLVTLFPMLPNYGISILCNLFNLPYLILPFENAFALNWYGRIFVIFYANFELFMLITKKNKLYSLAGALLIVFSPVCSWWSIMPILAWGPLAILVLNLFLKEKRCFNKILYTFLFSLIGINYIMLIYPAWQVPFGYVYLCFVIWILYENKTNLDKKQLIYLILSIIIMASVVIIVFTNSYEIFVLVNSTVYPGARFITGGYGYERLFNYLVNIFFPCVPYYNPCEFSDFISFYPIPILLGIYLSIKQSKEKLKNKDLLIFLLTIVGLLLSIWNFVKLPDFLIKISLLSFSVPERSSIVIGYICVLILIRYLSLYENNKILKKSTIISIIISFITTILGVVLIYKNFHNFLNLHMIIIIFIIFIPLIFLILINCNKYNKFLAIMLILISLFVGGTINPISKGVSVLTDKPFAKEIRKIIKEDNKSKWIVIDSHYAIPNYLIANGAPTINSTNYYPNLELFYKLDKEKKYEDIYNRYAHVLISLTNELTTFELVTTDTIKISLNIEDLNEIGAKYVVSSKKIEEKYNKYFELLYNEDGIYIYEYKNIMEDSYEKDFF